MIGMGPEKLRTIHGRHTKIYVAGISRMLWQDTPPGMFSILIKLIWTAVTQLFYSSLPERAATSN